MTVHRGRGSGPCICCEIVNQKCEKSAKERRIQPGFWQKKQEMCLCPEESDRHRRIALQGRPVPGAKRPVWPEKPRNSGLSEEKDGSVTKNGILQVKKGENAI